LTTQLTCQYSTWIRRPECPWRRYSSLPPEHPWTWFDGYLRFPEQSAACKHDGQWNHLSPYTIAVSVISLFATQNVTITKTSEQMRHGGARVPPLNLSHGPKGTQCYRSSSKYARYNQSTGILRHISTVSPFNIHVCGHHHHHHHHHHLIFITVRQLPATNILVERIACSWHWGTTCSDA